MPVNYYKCECGTEQRIIVPIDKTGFKELPNGRWRFDPEAAAAAKGTSSFTTIDCQTCGKTVIGKPDPKAVNSFIKFNFMES